MDYDSYVSIINNRGEISNEIINGYSYSMYAFRHDLLSNKTVWTNNYKNDLWSAIKTQHSLLSIFGVPKHHPYNKLHRIIIFLSSLCLSVLTSSIIVSISNFCLEISSLNLLISEFDTPRSLNQSYQSCQTIKQSNNKTKIHI